MQIECPHCHQWTKFDGQVCPLCGVPLETGIQNEADGAEHKNRNIYRILCLVCVIGAVIWIVTRLTMSEPEESNEVEQKIIEEIASGHAADLVLNKYHSDCLWYYENLPQSISRFNRRDEKEIATYLTYRPRYSCKKDTDEAKILWSWHLDVNHRNEKICYTYSFHPSKGTDEKEPGQFRLSIILSGENRGNVLIEPLSAFRPGYDRYDQDKDISFYYSVDFVNFDKSIAKLRRLENDFDYGIEINFHDLRKGWYLETVFPVTAIDPGDKQDIFYFVYRLFPLKGIDTCGEWVQQNLDD